ncbi:MAG: MFS transporter, partial [Nocardioidaceae bacterium]
GVAEASVTMMLFLYGLGAVIGNLASGYFTDRSGSVRVLTVTYVGMAAGLAALAWVAASGVSQTVLVGFLAAVWGGMSWAQTPPQQHRLIAAAPQEVPLVVSLNSSFIYLGIGAGTALGGVVLSAGPPMLYAVGAAIALVSLVFLRVVARTGSAAA